ncbi:hypothetical protein AB4Z48_14145 [Cupriavidus sp. 2TAF22]|uniref:hypothetical protein n=1 Tax=unclassified Cupriavidus TaxID=2640874 RepID=UPI003F923717
MKTPRKKMLAMASAVLLAALTLPALAAQQPAFDSFSQGARKPDAFSDGARQRDAYQDGAHQGTDAGAIAMMNRDVFTDGTRDVRATDRMAS